MNTEETNFASRPSPERHPARMSAIARLLGIGAAMPETASVLELGCGSADSLLAIASVYPKGRYVGVDISASQIAAAEAGRKGALLDNVELIVADLNSWDTQDTFDFVICHGLLSWCSQEIRERIFELSAKCLAPTGIACISYNCRSGVVFRDIIANMLRQADRPQEDEVQRVACARAVMDLLDAGLVDDLTPYGQAMKEELANLREQGDAFIVAELLNPESLSFSLNEVVQQASDFGLEYMADARPSRNRFFSAPEAVSPLIRFFWQEEAPALSRQRIDGLYDVISPLSFRSSLFYRSSAGQCKSIVTDSLSDFWVSSALQIEGPVQPLEVYGKQAFADDRGYSVNVFDPEIKLALGLLSQSWPEEFAVSDLESQVGRQLGPLSGEQRGRLRDMLLAYFFANLVDLSPSPLFAGQGVESKPFASNYVRWQSANWGWLTNAKLEYLSPGQLERRLLSLMDGTKEVGDLVEYLFGLISCGELVVRQEDGRVLQDPQEQKEYSMKRVGDVVESFRQAGYLIPAHFAQNSRPERPT